MAPKRKIEGLQVYRFTPGIGTGDLIQIGDYNSLTIDGAKELALKLLGMTGQDGAWMIAAERKRQVEREGWSSEHDDQHTLGQLAVAGACYALTEDLRGGKDLEPPYPVDWPWEMCDWKPCPNDRVRELAKAGALIAAEIDRLIRAGGK